MIHITKIYYDGPKVRVETVNNGYALPCGAMRDSEPHKNTHRHFGSTIISNLYCCISVNV